MDLFTEEAMVPCQFYPQPYDSPERTLMRAVLEQALDDLTDPRLLQYPSARGRARLRCQAATWFASDDTTWPFSFANICQTLGLDAGAIRRALLPTASAIAVTGIGFNTPEAA